MKHDENCGRPGTGCALNCQCWCHKGCCLDVEIAGKWHTLKKLDSFHQAQTLANDLANAGIHATVSCACGSYEFGACELCAEGR